MKYIQPIILAAVFTCLLKSSFAQNINWKSLEPTQRHILNLNIGFENAFVMGVGYGYHFNSKMPLVLNIEFSMPAGENLFDDGKAKIGGQLNILQSNNFYATIKAYGVIRRFENDLSRMVNFGSEFSGTAGYYSQKWFVAGEIGFDKAIVTHIKHSDLMKEYNPTLESGWYIPTGGNFFYGVQTGYSFKQYELNAKIGGTISQDLKTKTMVPYYFQLGWNVKW